MKLASSWPNQTFKLEFMFYIPLRIQMYIRVFQAESVGWEWVMVKGNCIVLTGKLDSSGYNDEVSVKTVAN